MRKKLSYTTSSEKLSIVIKKQFNINEKEMK
jgi:hypothetical protein